MSFTTNVKNEISKVSSSELEKIIELTTIITLSEIIDNQVKISTENHAVARRIYQLVKDVLKVVPLITVRKGRNYLNKHIFIISVTNIDLIRRLEISDGLPSIDTLEDDESKRSFLLAMFLMSASINDPKTSRYHLEFLLNDEKYAYFLNKILNDYSFNSKVLKRENKYMIYMKESEKISDFLRLVKAFNSLFYYEDIRIYRDHKNMTNRLNNCEQANVDKIIASSVEQTKQIESIRDNVGLELLGEKELIVAEYRLKYPEVSLLELSEIITYETGKKITKSGIYHRLKKIKELYEKIS